MKPMMSIVIPVYNGANYMREAIDSALAQTYENVEVLVVNDGSSDGGATEEIALSYGNQIRYFAKENGGVATALNLGIKEMRGEYFSWLSHDDLYAPEKLSAQWEAIQACGMPRAIVYSDYNILDMETGGKVPVQMESLYPARKLEDSVFPVLYGLIQGCSLLIHKSHFERAGLFDETLRTSQDYDLWFRMLRGQKLVFVPRSLICSRHHPEQGTHVITCFRQEEIAFYRKAYMALTEKELYEIFGHPAFLYWRLEGILSKSKEAKDSKAFEKRYKMMAASPDGQKKRLEFLEQFQALRKGTDKICIFCCGQYGKDLRKILSDFGIWVDFFADNNPGMWGKQIDGCVCISPDELQKIQKNTLILAAAFMPQPVLRQLKNMGCQHVASKQMLESFMGGNCNEMGTPRT